MSLFAAAAQKQLRELTGTVGLTSTLADIFQSRGLTARGLWNKTLNGLATTGGLVMDIGALVVGLGWRITIYGFFAWAGVGILRNLGRLAGVLGAEVLRSIPDAVGSAA